MAGESQQVKLGGGHIQGQNAGSLGGIQQEMGAVSVGQPADFLYGEDGPADVGGVIADYQAGAPLE